MTATTQLPDRATPLAAARGTGRLSNLAGISWLTLWLAYLVAHLDIALPFNVYYTVVGVYLLYFSFTKTAQLPILVTKLLFLLWAFTAVAPMLMYFLGATTPIGYISMRSRIVAFSIVAGTALLLTDARGKSMLRTASLISLAISITFNLVELVVPNILSTSPGRSAGFYQNPNISAAGIIVCLIMAIDFTRHRRSDMIVLLFGALAVVATFSRAGMLFVTLLVLLYVLLPQGPATMSASSRLGILAGLGLGAAIVVFVLLNFLSLEEGAYSRLMSVVHGDLASGSTGERVDAALFAFQQFLEHFWTGRGLGAPEYYDLRAHNSFVHIGVEYGVAGVALYAIILLASLAKVVPYGFRAAPGQTLLTVYLIYYSVFDHYVHSYPTFSVAFGAIIAGTLLPERVDPPQRPAFGDPA